ncbi:hypothetical protein HCN44_008866 [Aphidius gifuensis]|uniref:Uncharacterized protein n=1 Tax=Aphidius gifuensis TaxID=684658 RepID=A0A834Y1U9_APHGI|nr:hypothetical protein HCN44_008866 [Aphidius gifuensis]
MDQLGYKLPSSNPVLITHGISKISELDRLFMKYIQSELKHDEPNVLWCWDLMCQIQAAIHNTSDNKSIESAKFLSDLLFVTIISQAISILSTTPHWKDAMQQADNQGGVNGNDQDIPNGPRRYTDVERTNFIAALNMRDALEATAEGQAILTLYDEANSKELPNPVINRRLVYRIVGDAAMAVKPEKSNSLNNEEEIIDDPDEIASKLFLDTNVDPLDEVVAAWKKTINMRKRQLFDTHDQPKKKKKQDNNTDNNETVLKIGQFLNAWSSLKAPYGHQLVELDFAAWFPEASQLTTEKLAGLLEKLFLRLQSTKKN